MKVTSKSIWIFSFIIAVIAVFGIWSVRSFSAPTVNSSYISGPKTTITQGEKVVYVMYFKLSDGSTIKRGVTMSSSVQWVVIPSNIGTIDRSGLFTASPTYTGPGTIKAISGGSQAILQISIVKKPVEEKPRVAARAVTSVYLSPSKTTATQGEKVTYAMYFRFSDGATEKRTSDVAWSVTPSSLGTIDRSGSFTASPTYTGGGTIKAISGGNQATLPISVVKPVEEKPKAPTTAITSVYISGISGPKTTVTQGEKVPYAMYFKSKDGPPQMVRENEVYGWNVIPSSFGTINRDGVFTASPTHIGTATITAIWGAYNATLQISIVRKSVEEKPKVPATAIPTVWIEKWYISGPKTTVTQGEKVPYAMYFKSKEGATKTAPPGSILWSVEPPSIGTIDRSGLLTASPTYTGPGTIKAISSGNQATLKIYIARSVEEKPKVPAEAVTSVQPPPPRLLYPSNGATLAQPYLQPWIFRWDNPTNPEEVKQYNLLVIHESAALPVADVMTTQTSHSILEKCSYIIDKNRFNWKWKVRVQNKNGLWSSWSNENTFKVDNLNWDLLYKKCPSLAHVKEEKPKVLSPTPTSGYISGSKTTVTQGEKVPYAMYFKFTDGTTKMASPSDVMWSVIPSSFGTINRDGVFTASPTHIGTATITAICGAYNATLQLSVVKPVETQPRVASRKVKSCYISGPNNEAPKITFTQGETVQYAFYISFSDGTTEKITTGDLEWNRIPTGIGYIDHRSGLFTASKTYTGGGTIRAVRVGSAYSADLPISIVKKTPDVTGTWTGEWTSDRNLWTGERKPNPKGRITFNVTGAGNNMISGSFKLEYPSRGQTYGGSFNGSYNPERKRYYISYSSAFDYHKFTFEYAVNANLGRIEGGKYTLVENDTKGKFTDSGAFWAIKK